jgi:hypothetical protein
MPRALAATAPSPQPHHHPIHNPTVIMFCSTDASEAAVATIIDRDPDLRSEVNFPLRVVSCEASQPNLICCINKSDNIYPTRLYMNLGLEGRSTLFPRLDLLRYLRHGWRTACHTHAEPATLSLATAAWVFKQLQGSCPLPHASNISAVCRPDASSYVRIAFNLLLNLLPELLSP